MAAPHDLKRLTALAFHLSQDIDGKDVTEGYLTFARAIFRGICFAADAVLRLHPESCYYVPWGRHTWNPTGMAALARVLLDGCVGLHYFALDPVPPDERECRFIIANLHCMREREDSARMMEAGRPPEPPPPDDWSGVPLSEYPVMKARLERSLIPDQLAFWKQQLGSNKFFLSGSPKERAKWLDGKGLYTKQGQYIGSQQDAGFILRRRERARRAGILCDTYDLLYRHLSSHSHIAAHAVSQLRAFHPDDRYSREGIELSVQVACAAVALAIRYVSQVFPDCDVCITPDLVVMLNVYPNLLLGLPGPLQGSANGGGAATEGQCSCTDEEGDCQPECR